MKMFFNHRLSRTTLTRGLAAASQFALRAYPTRPFRGGRINVRVGRARTPAAPHIATPGRARSPSAPHWIVAVCTFFALALTSFAAEPGITVSARQRYPWNGLVDINFAITGDAGTKYDTSFTAKDMVGGTNITMATVRKADGTAANVAKEQLLPGTYKWVWDAATDLPEDFVCDRLTITGTAVEDDLHKKVQLWEGGPYWAETNIGAEDPWDYGCYFWWGDTVGYKRENNVWVASDGSSSKYSFSSQNTPTYGKSNGTLNSEGWLTDNNFLDSVHDAAHVQWGGDWRMPTKQEMTDLINNCDWTWTTTNGVSGYVVCGRGGYAASCIFLPVTGYGQDYSQVYREYGYYWTSAPSFISSYYNMPYYAYFLYICQPGHSNLGTGSERCTSMSGDRQHGAPIRPVQGGGE